jgi:hypothetical protein
MESQVNLSFFYHFCGSKISSSEMLDRHDVKTVRLALIRMFDNETVERWDFDVEQCIDENGNVTEKQKTLTEIQNEMRAVFMQIASSVSLLPPLKGHFQYKISVVGRPGCVWPKGWRMSGDHEVKNSREMLLTSVSTGVHLVNTKVLYQEPRSYV